MTYHVQLKRQHTIFRGGVLLAISFKVTFESR